MTSSSSSSEPPIPILFLKTRSVPNDGYYDEFSSLQTKNGRSFEPIFVPVLEHKILDEGITFVRSLLEKKEIGNKAGCKYGGMIFTSQRAVEAFAMLVSEGQREDRAWPYLENTPIYTVGPATSRALSSIPTTPPLSIHGKETGNGEALAHYMLSHYPSTQISSSTTATETASSSSSSQTNNSKREILPLLFLVGETRRDIIPKTLSSHNIPVEEIEVYGTSVMSSFEETFTTLLNSPQLSQPSQPQNPKSQIKWIIVFSPTGCEAMLRSLGLLDPSTGRVLPGSRNARIMGGREGMEGGKEGETEGEGKTFIASIGPTTRDYLMKEFGFEVDVCAEKPSPEGVREGILKYMAERERVL